MFNPGLCFFTAVNHKKNKGWWGCVGRKAADGFVTVTILASTSPSIGRSALAANLFLY